jgi:hypothetical protein
MRPNSQIEGMDAALCGQSRSNAELGGGRPEGKRREND